jgi:glycosyltransferase involved in cell wall biosynthesis
VLIPTIGHTAYLRQTLAALKKQTYPHYEALVLDNASGEETQVLLSEYARADPHLRVLFVDGRVSMFATFNRGIREARGKCIIFFHDDVYLPTFLVRGIALMEKDPELSFVGSNCGLINAAGKLRGEAAREGHPRDSSPV